jgi:uncharacterized Fe-S cluster-containing radical SAM superfamily protein
MNTKLCSSCNEEKYIGDFYNDRKTKDGKGCHCKACVYVNKREWMRRNPVKVHEQRLRAQRRNPGFDAERVSGGESVNDGHVYSDEYINSFLEG